MYKIKMSIIVFFLLCIGNVSKAQDSLYVGQCCSLTHVYYPNCMKWGEEWAEREIEEKYSPFYDSVAEFIKGYKNLKFEIKFYTDSRGSDSANLILTQIRADAWFKHLVSRGIDSLQVKAVGYGESTPRTVWIKDTIYYTNKPKEIETTPIILTEQYINSFRNTNKIRFEMLHQLNRREELCVISIIE